MRLGYRDNGLEGRGQAQSSDVASFDPTGIGALGLARPFVLGHSYQALKSLRRSNSLNSNGLMAFPEGSSACSPKLLRCLSYASVSHPFTVEILTSSRL